ncbi:MAG: glycoside hydrolase superfamily [Benniella sp.]|nr:MAG: glycoside hydrolase superfamily [Benniella sp.]
MSQFNNAAHNPGGHITFHEQRQHTQPQQLDSQYSHQYHRSDDDGSSSVIPTEQRGITSQQYRQEERRRHAEATAAAAGTGASSWFHKQSNKSGIFKRLAGAAVVLLLVLAGVLAWYFAVHKKNQGHNTSCQSRSGNSGGHAAGPTVVTPNGTVVPNTNYAFKRVFYGMAYVPLNAQLPVCYNTQQTVDDELQLLVQTTKRVRLYGTDCNVLRFTLDAIQRLKLDLQVVAGIWIDRDNATFMRQRDEFFSVISAYGWGHPEIPVFTSDLVAAVRPPLTDNEDKAGVNLHPFFAGVPVSEAGSWFWKYFEQTVAPGVNKNRSSPMDIWITEVGWPTFPATSNTNASIPSIPNLQTFLDTWLCEANARDLPYYYFEFVDAPWMIWPGSAVEGFWGLLTIDKKLKVRLPDCLAN